LSRSLAGLKKQGDFSLIQIISLTKTGKYPPVFVVLPSNTSTS